MTLWSLGLSEALGIHNHENHSLVRIGGWGDRFSVKLGTDADLKQTKLGTSENYGCAL